MLSSPEPVAEPKYDQVIQPHTQDSENDGNLGNSRDYVRNDFKGKTNKHLASLIEVNISLWPPSYGTWSRGRLPKKEILENVLLNCGFKTSLPLPEADSQPSADTPTKRTTSTQNDVAVQKVVDDGSLAAELKKQGVVSMPTVAKAAPEGEGDSGSLDNGGHIAQPGFDGREILRGWTNETDKVNEQHPPGLLDMESLRGSPVLVQDNSDVNIHQQFPPPGIFGGSDLITVYLTDFRKVNGEGSEAHYMIPRCHGDLSLSGGWYIYSQDLVASIQSSPSHIHGFARLSVQGTRPGFDRAIAEVSDNVDPHCTGLQVEVNADGQIDVFVRAIICAPEQTVMRPAIKDEGTGAENMTAKRTRSTSYDDNETVPMQDDELLEVRLPKKGRSTEFSFATAGRAQKLLEKKKEIKPYLFAAVQARDGYCDFHEMKGKPNQHPTVIKNIYTFARDFVKEYDDRMTSAVKSAANPVPTEVRRRISKVDCLEALGRDDTWYTNSMQDLLLLEIMGPGGAHEDARIVALLDGPVIANQTGLGVTKLRGTLKEVAKEKGVSVPFKI